MEVISEVIIDIHTTKHVAINYNGAKIRYYCNICEANGKKYLYEYKKLSYADLKNSDKKKIRKFLIEELSK